MTNTPSLSSIDTIIEDARAGRMFILVDDEDRENEGDLVIPAQMANADAINFMAKHGRGLICLSLTEQRVRELQLPMMSPKNSSRHQTAFTVSIEAREGVTTGISAADRAHTIAVAIDPQQGPQALASPGHVFPLMARDGGVLVRAGHTEAAVDIARLAGLNPAGVICEIMNDDGTMARLPDLISFAQKHGLHIATIADLIAWRRRSEKLVHRAISTPLHTQHAGEFMLHVYQSDTEGTEHLALVKGNIETAAPVWVRMHALHVLPDVLGATEGGKAKELEAAMRQIDAHGSGVVVLLREPATASLAQMLRERLGQSIQTSQLRDYGIGAQILLDLGIKDMILLSNTRRSVIGLEGYGLHIHDYESIHANAAEH